MNRRDEGEARVEPRRGRRRLRWFGWTVLVLAAGAMAGRTYLQDGIDSVVRKKVEQHLAGVLPGMDVHVDRAHLVRKKGIELRGVTIAVPGRKGAPDISIDRVWIACSTGWTDLVSGKVALFAVDIERPAVRLVRDSEGQWNLRDLAGLRWQRTERVDFPQVNVRDGRIDVDDARRPGRPLELRGLTGQLRPTAAGWELNGQLKADRFGRIRVAGDGNTVSGKWRLRGTLTEIEFSPESCRLLPHDLLADTASLGHVTARGELEFELSGTGWQPPRFQVHGTVQDARVDDARLPYPIDGLRAEVRVTNERFELRGLRARLGGSHLSANIVVDEWLAAPRLELQVGFTDLTLDERLRAVCRQYPPLQRLWTRFAPSGLVDLSLRARVAAGQLESLKADVVCRDVSIRFEKFPYPVGSMRGRLRWDDGTWKTENLSARVGNQRLHIAGTGRAYPGGWTGEVNLSTSGFIPLDARLTDAFPDAARKFIRSLSPTGKLRLHRAVFRRREPYQKTENEITVEFTEGSLNYDKFPYPLTRVRGWVLSHNDRWEVREAEGHHGMTRVGWNAAWSREANVSRGIDLRFALSATDVVLDPDLLRAIERSAPHAARAWRQLRPEGVVDDLAVELRFRTSRGIEGLEVRASKRKPDSGVARRSISIEPDWFPYRWEEVAGDFRFVDGRIELRDISGHHGETALRLGGTCRFDRLGRWSVHLNRVTADRVVLAPELLGALPPPLRSALESLRVDGMLTLDGTATLQGQAGSEPDAEWNVRVEMAGGNLHAGPGLFQIYGGIQLIGERKALRTFCRGELDLDSVYVKGLQITHVRGPLRFDPRQLRLGVHAEPGIQGRPPRSITGKLLRGNMTLDGLVWLRPELPYDVQLALVDGELSELSKQLTGRPPGNTAGRFSATVRIRGDETAVHTRRGEGAVRIRDAKLYELPVMVALLSVLRLKTPDRTAFRQVDLDFRIVGDHLQFDRIDLTGNALTLRGRGWANLQQEIRFQFYTVVGRDELVLPILRTVLAEASRQILEIEVAGTLNRPQVQRTAFPELDATLQRLFPEFSQQSSAVRR